MEDFHINKSGYDRYNNYNHSDITYDNENAGFIIYVVTWIIISVGLPLNVAAIYATYSLVRKDHYVAPVYFINLLISDVIQLCSMIILLAVQETMVWGAFFRIYGFGLMASIHFMVCITLERYLFIISPRCSCFRQAMKISVVVCFLFWAPSLFWLFRVLFFDFMSTEIKIILINFLVLLPFPLLIFFLGGTLKALSAAISVPPDEKRRTVAILVLMLLIYTLLHLPYVIWSLATGLTSNPVYFTVITTIRLVPLANVCVYVFLRKGAVDRLLACVCCCRMDNGEISSRVNDDTVITVSSV